MPFLILSIQEGQVGDLPAIAPRGLMMLGDAALHIACEVQRSRYSEFVTKVIIYELNMGAGWDPGDFRDDSPYIVYAAERNQDSGVWNEKFKAFEGTPV